jgi:hypothetical protein
MDPEHTKRPNPPNPGPPPTARAALRSRPFASLLAGYAVSALGDGMAAVAISWLAIELARGRDTGLLVGAAIAAYTLPGIVAGLGLGRLLNRWDPRLLVLAEAVVRAACLGVIAAGAAAGFLTPAGYIALLGVSSLLGLLGVTGSLTAVAELLPEGAARGRELADHRERLRRDDRRPGPGRPGDRDGGRWRGNRNRRRPEPRWAGRWSRPSARRPPCSSRGWPRSPWPRWRRLFWCGAGPGRLARALPRWLPLRHSEHVGLPREHLLGQHPVYLGVGVQAGVRQHDEPVVEVGGLAQGGQHHAAGRDAG